MTDGVGAAFPLVTSGTYQSLFAAAQAAGMLGDTVEQILSVDSTIVRAHHHAAGARASSVSAEAAAQSGCRQTCCTPAGEA